MKSLQIVAVVIGGLAFICFAAACGGTQWLKYESEVKYESGLWKDCFNSKCLSKEGLCKIILRTS